MADKTPQKREGPPGFSPIILRHSPGVSPQKNLTGPPRIVKDITADLFNTIQKWNNLHIDGYQIVKQIALTKSDIFGRYSLELEKYTDQLYKIVKNIECFVEVFEKLNKQMAALEKLHNKQEILFSSCRLWQLKEWVDIITIAYLNEVKVKEMVLENIAHSRNKDDLMFFAASWSHQPHITKDVNLKLEGLLVETGHHNYN